MLLNVSNNYAYFHHGIEPIRNHHRPYFLVLGGEDLRERLMKNLSSPTVPLNSIVEVGEVEEYHSFSRPDMKLKAFKVYTEESKIVPKVSDYLFFRLGMFTAEHDIPYIQRATADLASEGKWIFDTGGEEKTLRVMAYDIETPDYERKKDDAPIEIIGFTEFDVVFSSHHDIEKEEFELELKEIEGSWETDEIIQLQAKGGEDEVKTITEFIGFLKGVHIIAGHNILSFDNHHLYHRINAFLDDNDGILSSPEKKLLEEFKEKYTRVENFYNFGRKSTGIQFFPVSFDTYHAALRFYRFLNSFSLKELAPFLGVKIPKREYIDSSEMGSVDWERLMLYNRHDIKEQSGITRLMLHQALPLAFITGMPMEMLLPAGTTKVWDYMTIIRGAKYRKVIPPTCRAHGVSKTILKILSEEGVNEPNKLEIKEELIRAVKEREGKGEELDKELLRVVKYGAEMPDWVRYPYLIANVRRSEGEDENTGYHLPGGMTIQPAEVKSDFIPWWHMLVADVGAMYPTILKGKNVGADSVRLAKKGEKPDDWVWLKYVSPEFLERDDIVFRPFSDMKEENYADRGYFIGIKISSTPGLVNRAMTGILGMIFRIKNELRRRREAGENVERLKMMYQSLKGLRNAGTHGILVASNVSCRQFNLWGGAEITTTGQRILNDAMQELEKRKMRVVYGDTDGIYVACSRSAYGIPQVCSAFGVKPGKGEYITDPEEVKRVINLLNHRWREKLRYPGFELEMDYSDAMLFVKHKNYLIWKAADGKLKMYTKGNNFRGSDKAPIARKVLEDIMFRVLKDHLKWENEERVRESVKHSIIKHTMDVVNKLDLSNVKLDDLILVQSVKPPSGYKSDKEGSGSNYLKRAKALEKLLGKKISAVGKFRFVVTKMPLPGIDNPSKTGVKPIDYMYPIECLSDLSNIDLEWYRNMIKNYVKGAFGLAEIDNERTVQRGLHEYM